MNERNPKKSQRIEQNLKKERLLSSDYLNMTVEDDGNLFSRFLVITANNHNETIMKFIIFFHLCVVEVHTMASSKAKIVKFLKAFATYS